MRKEPIDYTQAVKEFYEDLPDNEREVLEKILTDEEERLWVDVQYWIREIKFFATVDAIKGMIGLNDKEEDKKRKKDVRTFYTSHDIPWLIHKYWMQPKKYLLERLSYARSSQSFMLNIYSAVLITAGLGIWVLCVKSFIDSLPNVGFFFADYLKHIPEIISFIIVSAVVFGGLALLIWNDARRRTVLRLKRTLITGSLNCIDVESYIIASILEMKKVKKSEADPPLLKY